MSKIYELTESGKAVLSGSNTCPICGAGGSGNTRNRDFVSNVWTRIPLTCGHGFVIGENLNVTSDAAKDDWQQAILIRPEYIPELEALGYEEAELESYS